MNGQIQETIAAVEAFIAGRDDANPLPCEAAQFVHGLLLATRARAALEIGTSYGYSGLWIAAALARRPGEPGRLITIDRDRRKSDIAVTYFAQAGLAELVQCRNGIAAEVLATLEGPFDFVLNDADKHNCRLYVETLLPQLAERAVVLTDNVRTHAAELAEFLTWIRRHPAFVSTPVPVGNGMEMSVRVASSPPEKTGR